MTSLTSSSVVTNRWFDRADVLSAAACGTLASAVLLLVVPNVGTLFFEILASLVFATRAVAVRSRQRKARQLHLSFGSTSGVRTFDRYVLVLLIAVMLAYFGISGALRAQRVPEGLVRVLPLTMFAIGLLGKQRIVRWVVGRRQIGTGAKQRADVMSIGTDS